MHPQETKRTFLLAVELEHVDTLAKLWTDADVRQYLGGVVEPEIGLDRVRSYIGLESHRTVVLKETHEILGVVMLTPRDENMEISYLFFPAYWGMGYAREASARLIQFGFEELGLKRIVAVTQTANERSIRLLNSLDMTLNSSFEEFGAEQSEYVLINLRST